MDSRPRLAVVIEGSRSQSDHRALSLVAQSISAQGITVKVLHHGLGRLARFRLRQQLRGFAADLFVVTGDASLAEVHSLATLAGKPVVVCYWPHGEVHNVHMHRAETKDRVKRAVPSHAVIGTAEQRQALGLYFGPSPAWSEERIHQVPLALDDQPPSPEILLDIAELLIECLGEQTDRALGRGLIKASAARVLSAVSRPKALSLAYHQVVRELRGVDLNLVVGATTFERQVRALLARGYRPLTQEAQIQELLSPKPSVPPSFAISFDDGYLDTLEVAAPILQSLGVPFTVYCISDLVSGKRRLPWYELVQHALFSSRTADRTQRLLAQCDSLRQVLAESAEVPGFLRLPAVLRACKQLDDTVREQVCAALWDALGDEVLSRPHVPRYLDAAGVQRLTTFGVEISSHTCRHPILTLVSDSELQRELVESRRLLSELVGRCPGLAYPNGDSDARVEAAAQAAGYDYAVRIEPESGPTKRYRIGRQMVSELFGMGMGGGFSEKIFFAKLLRKR